MILIKIYQFRRIAVHMVHKKKQKINNILSNDKLSLLEKYLTNPALDEKDVVGMACDMLLAGVDTVNFSELPENILQLLINQNTIKTKLFFQTTYSTAYALYHLGNNVEVQEKLHQEASLLLPNKNDIITAEVLENAKYVKAVLKETLRLNPISVGIGRILQTDVVLSGYNVPKGVSDNYFLLITFI